MNVVDAPQLALFLSYAPGVDSVNIVVYLHVDSDNIRRQR